MSLLTLSINQQQQQQQQQDEQTVQKKEEELIVNDSSLPSVVFIYVVDESLDEKNNTSIFHFKSYARCHIQSTLQLMGVKQRDADSITEIVYEWLSKANHLKHQIQSDVIVNDPDNEEEVEFLTTRPTEEDQDNYGDNEEDSTNKRATTTPTESSEKKSTIGVTPARRLSFSTTNRSRSNSRAAANKKHRSFVHDKQSNNNNNNNNNSDNDNNNNILGNGNNNSDGDSSGDNVDTLITNEVPPAHLYYKKSRLQLICNKICGLLLSGQNMKTYRPSITASVVKVLSAYLIRNDRNKLNDNRFIFSSSMSKVDISHRRDIVFLTRQQFQELLHVALALYEYSKPTRKDDLIIACQIRERKTPLIVLFGGTSGCGKSTLASLLASRLGITKVLSTDSVRHMLRGFISKEQNPVLFASTYHAGECIRNDPKYANLTEDELVIEGYRQQCRLVIDQLDKIIFNCQKHNEPLVVEGVHLLTDFMIELMKKYPNCIVPYVIYISNDQKHKERFAFRAKYMTLEPRNNKYVQYFEHIRQIQGYLCSRADHFDVPKIDNTNIDRSLATIHASVFKSIKKVALNGECLYDFKTNKANVSRTYTKPIWNSSRMLKVIRKKRSSLEINASVISSLTIATNTRPRIMMHKRCKTEEESDTDSDESTRTDDGKLKNTDDSAEEAAIEFPLRFSPKMTRFERNHRRLIRNRRKLQFSNSLDNTQRADEVSSESDQDLNHVRQSSDTDGAVGSLSEFSDSITDVRHIDYFDAS